MIGVNLQLNVCVLSVPVVVYVQGCSNLGKLFVMIGWMAIIIVVMLSICLCGK